MRLLRAALAALGWALLGLAALAGLALSAGAFLALSDVGRTLVASSLVRIADEAVAGHLELEGIAVLPSGGVELRGLRVLDPDGHLVLGVERVQVSADVTRLRNRVIGLSAEVEGASVLLEEEAGGGVSLARAFAPSRPSLPRPPGAESARNRLTSGWRLRVQRLTVRRSDLWWVDAAGATRLEVQGVDLDARGVLGPDRSRAELSLRGNLEVPASAPVSLEVRAALDGRALRVPVLRAKVGDTALDGLGVVDLARRSGRVALARLAVDPAQVHAVLPRAELGGELGATAYAESDGTVATAAVQVTPAGGGADAGRGAVAAAARVSGARALGLDVVLDRLDPSRVHARAPRGELTLAAHGGVAGADLQTLRGRVTLSLKRSRLRGGEVGPGELAARADRGRWDVQRLSVEAPGLEARGSGSWRPGGPVSGKVALDGQDLARAVRNLEALLAARLPPLGGRATAAGTLGGTAAAPVIDATLEAPRVTLGGLAIAGAQGEARLSGPLRAATAEVKATVRQLAQGGRELAHGLSVQGELTRTAARVEASAAVPGLGNGPVTLHVLAERTARLDEVVVSELTVAYPGTRYALAGPARATLSAPRVDRLELAAGAQRIVLQGGVGERSALDARLTLEALRLERLPQGLLPAAEGLAGELSADLRATGTTRAPALAGHLAVAGGRWRGLDGLGAMADLRWDGAARRAALSLGAERAAGGSVSAALDLPLPLAGRPGEPVSVRVDGEALPLDLLLAAARVDLDASGTLSLHARLSGAAGAPALEAEVALEGAAYQDLSAIGLTLAAEAPGERLRARVEARLAGEQVLRASGELPLDLSDLLASPAETLRQARTAPVIADAELPGVELASLAGRLVVPEGVAGRLTGQAHLEGTLVAPRGTASLAVEGGAFGGYTGLSARVGLDAGAEQVAAEARVALRGEEVLRASASLKAPPERLTRAAGLRAAPLALEAVVPRVSLARTSPAEVALEGTVAGRLTADGTLGAPRVVLDGEGTGLSVEGRPLGDVTARGRWAGASGTAGLTLAAAAGGTLDASLTVEAPLSADLRPSALRAAPAVVTVRARALGLGFLAALAPGMVRTASGTLEVDVEARGPLAKPVPRGTVRLTEGRIAVSEYGDWTGITVDAAVSEDAVELTRIAARRGHGSLEGRGWLRGMARGEGKLEGRLTTEQLPIMRGGEDLATLDLQVNASGTYRPGALKVDLAIPRGTVRLPNRPPRTLQSLEGRSDITVGPKVKRRVLAVVPPGAEGPFALTVHVVVPGRLAVVSDNPRIRVELKGDVTWELEGAAQAAGGTVEVVRGDVEPIGGRNFQVMRGKLTFTGGPPKAAVLDVEAVYENLLAAVKVTAAVTGPLAKPALRLSSEPPLDEGQIALLLVTGRTEFKAGGGGVGTITGEEAGKAALGAVATQMFKNLVAGKLPLDTVAVDPSALRAGKYVSDRIYVAYTRRFDVQLDQGQNTNEIQVQYQITPRWMLESRYGDAQTGGASLIWSKSY